MNRETVLCEILKANIEGQDIEYNSSVVSIGLDDLTVYLYRNCCMFGDVRGITFTYEYEDMIDFRVLKKSKYMERNTIIIEECSRSNGTHCNEISFGEKYGN